VVLQKSLREGFAPDGVGGMWKRRAVVASAVGGIPLQVLHERTGLLVRSIERHCVSDDPLSRQSRAAPGPRREGHVHVRDNFLHTREVRDYLAVFARLVG
jgi:trehalose synthase